MAATNESIEQRIKDGTFREDLYYRLNVIPIMMPPLRERVEDLPLLVNHFLRGKVSPRNGQPFQISRAALDSLNAHDWPGNVRELENAIERACALCEDHVIRVSDLPPALQKYARPDISEVAIEVSPAPSATVEGLAVGRASEPASAADHSTSPASAAPVSPVTSLKNFIRDQELAHLNRALACADGNQEKAADLLGISVATLYRKLAGADE